MSDFKKLNIPKEWRLGDRSQYLRTHDPETGKATGYSILDGDTMISLMSGTVPIKGLYVRNVTIKKDSDVVITDAIELILSPILEMNQDITFTVNGHHSFLVDWGDGKREFFETNILEDIVPIKYSHKYSLTDTRPVRIKIYGHVPNIEMMTRSLIAIDSLDLDGLTRFKFAGCYNLQNIPDVGPKNLVTLEDAFAGCSNLDTNALSKWNFEKVVNMSGCLSLLKDKDLIFENKNFEKLVNIENFVTVSSGCDIKFVNCELPRLSSVGSIIDDSIDSSVEFTSSHLPSLRSLNRTLKGNNVSLSFNYLQLSVEDLSDVVYSSNDVNLTFVNVVFDKLKSISNLTNRCSDCTVTFQGSKATSEYELGDLVIASESVQGDLEYTFDMLMLEKANITRLLSSASNTVLNLDFSLKDAMSALTLMGLLVDSNNITFNVTNLELDDRESYSKWFTRCLDIDVNINKLSVGQLVELKDLYEDCLNIKLNIKELDLGYSCHLNDLINGNGGRVDLNIDMINAENNLQVSTLVYNSEDLKSRIAKGKLHSGLVINNMYRKCHNVDVIDNSYINCVGDCVIYNLLDTVSLTEGDSIRFNSWSLNGSLNTVNHSSLTSTWLNKCNIPAVDVNYWTIGTASVIDGLFRSCKDVITVNVNLWHFKEESTVSNLFTFAECNVNANSWHFDSKAILDRTFMQCTGRVSMTNLTCNDKIVLSETFKATNGDVTVKSIHADLGVDLVKTFEEYGSSSLGDVITIDGLATWRRTKINSINRAFSQVGNLRAVSGFEGLNLWSVSGIELTEPFINSPALKDIVWNI